MKRLRFVSLAKWLRKATSTVAPSQFTGLGLLSQPCWSRNWIPWFGFHLYYANRVKDGKGVLDTDTYIVVWTTTPFTITASRGLTVGADIDYVVVQPAGESRKFVVASELLNSLSEKFGWTDVQVLDTYRGQELNHIVTVHLMGWPMKLVILGDHMTDSYTGIVHSAWFWWDDYQWCSQWTSAAASMSAVSWWKMLVLTLKAVLW